MIDHHIIAGDTQAVLRKTVAIGGGLFPITGPEAEVLDDDMVALNDEPPIPNGDAIARGGLTRNGDVRLLDPERGP